MSDAVARILDANANRAREALRVVEETARFHLNHAGLALVCKALRHDLQAALAALGESEWLASRDVGGDVGTAMTVPGESRRDDMEAVVAANGKRLQEALRALEEYGKLRNAAAAARLEGLRYRSYEMEQQLARASRHREAMQTTLMLVLTVRSAEEYAARGRAIAAAAGKAGLRLLQLRMKEMSARDMVNLAIRAPQDAADDRLRWIVNDRVDVALAARAAGAHVGEQDLYVAAARRQLGGLALLGATASSVESARESAARGADYLGAGAAFPTGSKDDAVVRGAAHIAAIQEAVSIPVFAIGGIARERLPELRAAGIRRVAVGAAIRAADDLRAFVQDWPPVMA